MNSGKTKRTKRKREREREREKRTCGHTAGAQYVSYK